MTALKRTFITLLLLLPLFLLQARAEVHHSDFETFPKDQGSKYEVLVGDNWKASDAALHQLNYYDIVSIQNDDIIHLNNTDAADHYLVQLNGGGKLTYQGKNGIKYISVNYSCNENGDPVEFSLQIKYGDKTESFTVIEDDHALSGELPIAKKHTFELENLNITDDYELIFTNLKEGNPNINWRDVFFWDFIWEDYAGDVVEDDNNLWWSQPSGDYAQNTFIMVRGNKGEELSLYNNDELQHVQPALDGVYPVIKYQLSDGNYNLKAVSGNNEPSYRTYRASATGSQPKLALSLPENSLYNIGTEITATGLPGKELTVTITDHENNVVDAPFKGTGIVDFDLRGSRDELITVTVEADGAETLTQSYYISRYWIPETRGAVFNFNEPGSLYIGTTPLDEYESDINLARITNVPDGVIWLTFSNASLTAANTLRMEAGSQVQIEALYEEGRTEIDLAEISFHYHSSARSASEPLTRIDDETSKHVAKYKAESAVELDAVSVSHNIITGIENVSVDSELPESYFDLQGRRLTQRPSKGLYVIRKGNHGQLMKAE